MMGFVRLSLLVVQSHTLADSRSLTKAFKAPFSGMDGGGRETVIRFAGVFKVFRAT